MYCMRNGGLIDANQAVVSAFDRGFSLADGLFETILFKQGEPVCWQGHMDRLRAGLRAMSIEYKLKPTLLADCKKLISKNDLVSHDAAVRITVTRGVGSRGLSVVGSEVATCLIQASAYTPLANPIRLTVNHQCRRIRTPLSQYKTLDYTLNIYARYQAQQRGFDDAILLNEKNELVCTTAANLFLMIDDVLVTPPLHSGAVAGVERSRVLKCFQAKQQRYAVRAIHLNEIQHVTAGFITSSLIGCQSIKSIEDNGLAIGRECD